MINEGRKVECSVPNGAYKARIKGVAHKDFMIIFNIEILGGKQDGNMLHFTLERDDKSRNGTTFNTLNVLASCANLKTLLYPYTDLIGTEFYVTFKNSNIMTIKKLV